MARMAKPLLLLLLALLVIAPPAEAAKRRVPHDFYGVMWGGAATDAPTDQQDAHWALMATSGVESVRVVFRWSFAQRVPGPPDFSRTDLAVELAARHGIKLLPVVYGTPFWAGRDPQKGEASPPKRLSDFTAYVRQLVRRYGPHGEFWRAHPELTAHPIRGWQIWNEPHIPEYYSPTRPNDWASEYVRMLRASRRAVRAVDPGATIVLAAVADYIWTHLAQLYRAGARPYFDVVALNLFTARPQLVMRGVRFIRRVMRRYHDLRKPIWLTETGWPAAKGRVPTPEPAWQRAWYTTDAKMGARLSELYSLAASQRRRFNLQRVYWYTWSSGYSSGDLFDYMGLIHFDGLGAFERMPALRNYAASARQHEGCAKTSAGGCARRRSS
jgi:polysaccharide biosynthesis protein PslG